MSNAQPNIERWPRAALEGDVARLFAAAGLAEPKAGSVARPLVLADMMGHTTHGLALAPGYVDALESGDMACDGEPEVISDRGACVAWKGHRLPGAWLIERGIDLALERIAIHGVFTLTIAGSHHTGALATYLPRLTERGLLPILSCSGPAAAGVAPFGGTRSLFTPNPIAAGIPTTGDPVLLDISASITTNNRAKQLAKAGQRFPAAWALDAAGHPTDDPAAAVSGGGSLLPIGGLDHGHKGYGLALLVEALTQVLSGLGRNTHPRGTLMNVFLQVIDPDAFGGRSAFEAESTWLAEACRKNPPRPGVEKVRVPGEHAMSQQRAAQAQGVPLSRTIADALAACMAERGIVRTTA
ncbi:Ldh family oxidoreductase [Variovorax sp. J22R24]|uniref:Ldh family oxidoreductase n=1 Tax=Variovorax gracilis TaxID=3053502 RepID=UPI002575E874|nr:Ldh family oxidoreductase [Variovorax sp. J22R24]MDM0107708.1 Ldh family oxidoreductase [Variovorax sp. J22R24]